MHMCPGWSILRVARLQFPQMPLVHPRICYACVFVQEGTESSGSVQNPGLPIIYLSISYMGLWANNIILTSSVIIFNMRITTIYTV